MGQCWNRQSAGRTRVPIGSTCTAGLKESRPIVRAVSSPWRRAIQPWKISWTIMEKNNIGSWTIHSTTAILAFYNMPPQPIHRLRTRGNLSAPLGFGGRVQNAAVILPGSQVQGFKVLAVDHQRLERKLGELRESLR